MMILANIGGIKLPYPSRKKDYHKNKKDRHKNKKDRHKNKKNYVLAGIDGEAIKYGDKSYYVYLAISNQKPLIANEIRNLNTKEIFDYILSIPKTYRLVGFVLNYDIENWLKDIPDDAYLYLTGKMDVKPKDDTWKPAIREHKRGIYKGRKSYVKNSIVWQGYKLLWIPKKIFEIQDVKSGKRVRILDVWGYCQSSFVKAITNWKVATEEEIKAIQEGKEQREYFIWEELQEIEKYNQLELKLLVDLAYKILSSSQKALNTLELKLKTNYQNLYGPGALSSMILKKLNWPNEIGLYRIKDEYKEDFLSTLPEKICEENGIDNRQKEYLLNLPFICSYFGGRIECSSVGYWPKIYDYDLNSAYPTAITRIPKVNLEKCYYISKVTPKIQNWLLRKRYMGMYYISWYYGEKNYWNPFPFRTERGNVFYPGSGAGWICSPEIFAAYDTNFKFTILKAIIMPKTAGYGGGEKVLPDDLKTNACRAIEKMYEQRKIFKKKEGKGGAEYALKLILNSMYGKLLQQVGRNLEKLGLFNDFVASWITSWTRAQIWRAIAKYAHTKSILSIMTDGIVSTKKLNLELGGNLGQWDEKEYKDYLQLLPGLYQMKNDEIIERTRGMPKGFDFNKAYESLYTREVYQYKYRIFVGRRIWLSQCFALKDYLYQWPEMVKEYVPDLRSKRREYNNSLVYLNPGEKHRFIKPKMLITNENLCSFPFSLAFEDFYWIPQTEEQLENAILEEHVTDYGNYFRE